MNEQDTALYQRLRHRLQINPLQLDQDLIEMPALMMDAAEATAVAIAARDAAAYDVEIAESDASAALRVPIGASRAGEAKIKSETQIKTELPSHPLVVTARARADETRLDAALWQALVNALRTKSSSIDRIADLMVAGYLTPDAVASQEASALRRTPARGR